MLLSLLLRASIPRHQATAAQAQLRPKRVAAGLAAFVMAQTLPVVVTHWTLGVVVFALIRELLIGGLGPESLFNFCLEGQIFNLRIELLKLRDLLLFIRSAAVDRFFDVPENVICLLLFSLSFDRILCLVATCNFFMTVNAFLERGSLYVTCPDRLGVALGFRLPLEIRLCKLVWSGLAIAIREEQLKVGVIMAYLVNFRVAVREDDLLT